MLKTRLKEYYFVVKIEWGQSEKAETEEEAREIVTKTFYEEYGVNLSPDEIKLVVIS